MNKKRLNEAEICDALITPAIVRAGWDQRTQIRREYTFTAVSYTHLTLPTKRIV